MARSGKYPWHITHGKAAIMMFDAGATYDLIAARFNLTRNQVAGYLRRLGKRRHDPALPAPGPVLALPAPPAAKDHVLPAQEDYISIPQPVITAEICSGQRWDIAYLRDRLRRYAYDMHWMRLNGTWKFDDGGMSYKCDCGEFYSPERLKGADTEFRCYECDTILLSRDPETIMSVATAHNAKMDDRYRSQVRRAHGLR